MFFSGTVTEEGLLEEILCVLFGFSVAWAGQIL